MYTIIQIFDYYGGYLLMALTLSKKAQAVKPSSTLAITAKAKELKASGG